MSERSHGDTKEVIWCIVCQKWVDLEEWERHREPHQPDAEITVGQRLAEALGINIPEPIVIPNTPPWTKPIDSTPTVTVYGHGPTGDTF